MSPNMATVPWAEKTPLPLEIVLVNRVMTRKPSQAQSSSTGFGSLNISIRN